MKFKQILKDNIKRISAVILCMILLFTCVVPVLAYDGEAPSKILTANDLKEYTSKSFVYFNANHPDYGVSPIFSPFNLKVLDAVLSVSVIDGSDSSISTFEPSTYLAVSTGSLEKGNLKTHYFIPSIIDDPSIWEVFKDFFGASTYYGWNSYFAQILKYVFSSSSNNTSIRSNDGTMSYIYFNQAKNAFASYGEDFKIRTSTLAYEVSFKKDGTISSIVYGGCYETPGEAIATLGCLYYVSQIAIYSAPDALYSPPTISSIPSTNPILYEDVVNTNQYISTSTYSLTAMDYFAYDENVAGTSTSLLSNSVSLSVSTSFRHDMYYLYIPSHFLKEEYRDAADFTKVSCESTIPDNIPHYTNPDIYEVGKSWVFIPYDTSGGYFLEFPDGANSALYLKLLIYRSAGGAFRYYSQLISKVSYNLYCSIYEGSSYGYKYDLLGSFDAENTIYTGRSITFKYGNYQAVDYYNDITAINGASVNKYPSIVISNTSNQESYLYLRCLAFGSNCVVSIFPNSNTVGFYYYISPENIPNIIGGSSSHNPDLGDGERPSGSLDWENFWDITVDYENLYPDGFDLNLPDYPQINIELGSMENVFDIPDIVVDYLVEVLDWLSESATIFVDSVGGPVRKTYYIAFMILDAIPDAFSFMIIFSVAILLFLKILQAASATSYMVSTSAGSDKPQKAGKPKEKAKSKKQDNGKSGGK